VGNERVDEREPKSGVRCQESEGNERAKLKVRGTLGTLGILSLFLGKYGPFQECQKDANGSVGDCRSWKSEVGGQ
jgi:hypothetical protein